ncbi:MAG: hypothetical protein K2K16_12230 [Ruminococcus sp.]|nr:hypothetical protein [Ruminococcus sp.]
MNSELLQKKILLQRVHNMLKTISGIKVIEICENIKITDKIQNYYSCEKVPDLKIACNSENIYGFIIENMHLVNNMTVYILFESIPVKVKIMVVSTAVKSLWNTYHEITIIDENMTKVYEIGFDSRDEYNYLFDIFYIKTPE